MARNPFIITTELNLAGFMTGSGKLRTEIQKLQNQINKVKKDIAGTKVPTKVPPAPIMPPGGPDPDNKLPSFNKELKKTNNELSNVSRRVFIWGSAAAAIFGALQQLREFYNLTVKVNTAMGELAKVLPKTTDFGKLKSQSFDFAIEFGLAPTDVLQTLKRFGQAGLEAENAIQATRVALTALNTTGADTEQAISALIGANRIFNISWENMANVIDKVQRIQADFAIDAKDLIASITAIGPAITILGGDIDDLFGMIAAMGEAARISGKEAANSLKRVFSRIATDEGVQALQRVGVVVNATTNSFRPLRAIMGDLQKQWPLLSDVEKQNLSITLAQVRQYSKFQALMSNAERAQEALTKSEMAFGDAASANEIVMRTYAKRQATSTAETQKFFEAIYSSGLLEGLTLYREGIASAFGNMQSFSNTINTVILPLGAFAGGLFAVRKMMVGFNIEATRALRDIPTWKLLTKNTATLGIGFKGADGALKGFLSTTTRLMGVLGVVTVAALALAPAIGALVQHFRKSNAIFEDATKQVDAYAKTLKTLEVVGTLKGDTEAKYAKLLPIFQKLSKELPKSKNALELLKDSFTGVIPGIENGFGVEENADKMKKVLEGLSAFIKDTYLGTIDRALTETRQNIDSLSASLAKVASNTATYQPPSGWYIPVTTTANVSSELEELEKDYRKAYLKFRDIASIGRGDNVFEKYFSYTGDRKEFASLVEGIRLLTSYKEKLNDLQGMKFVSPAQTSRMEELNNLIDTNADSIVANAAGYLNFNAIVERATNTAKKAVFGSDYIAPLTAGAEMATLFTDKLVDNLMKIAKANLNSDEWAKLQPEIEKTVREMLNLSDATKTWMQQISPTAVLSGIKRTLDSVIGGFQGQIRVLDSTAAVLTKAGKGYNQFAEGVKIADSAVKQLVTRMKNNAERLTTLNAEIVSLQNLLEATSNAPKLANGDTTAASPKNIEENAKKMNSLLATQETLGAIQDENNKKLDRYLDYLLSIRGAYAEIVAQQKLQQQVLKNSLGAVEALFKDTKAFNDIFDSNPFDSFKNGEKVFKELLKQQLAFTQAVGVSKNKSESVIKAEKASLTAKAAAARLERERIYVLTTIGDKWGRIKGFAEEYSKVQTSIKNKIIDARLEMDKMGKTSGTSDTLSLELKALDKRKQAEKDGLMALYKNKLLRNEEFESKLSIIKLSSVEEEAEIRINNILERRQSLYSIIQNDVDGIKSSIVDWLTNQKQLIDDLSSRGGVFKALGRAASGITKVIDSQDAQIIAQAITGDINSFVKKVRGGITEGLDDLDSSLGNSLVTAVDNIKLPKDLQNALINASKFMMTGTYASIVSAWLYVKDNIIPGMTSTDGVKSDIKGLKPIDVNVSGFENLVPEGGLSVEFFEKMLTDFGQRLKDFAAAQGEVKKAIKDLPSPLLVTVLSEPPKLVVENQDASSFESFIKPDVPVNKESDWLFEPLKTPDWFKEPIPPVKEPTIDYSKDLFKGVVDSLIPDKNSLFPEGVLVPADLTPAVESTPVGKDDMNKLVEAVSKIDVSKTVIGDLKPAKESDNTITNLVGIMEETSARDASLLNGLKSEIKTGNITMEEFKSVLLESIGADGKFNAGLLESFLSTDVNTKTTAEATEKMTSLLEGQDKKGIGLKTETTNALVRYAGSLFGKIGGGQIAKATGRGNEFVDSGSSLGFLAGAEIIGGAFGGPIGALAGGLLGGLFGKKAPEEEKEILKSIENNTAKMVDYLSPELFNAPSNFVAPAKGSGQGGGQITIHNTINVNGNSLDEGTIDTLERQINDVYNRSSNSYSILEG